MHVWTTTPGSDFIEAYMFTESKTKQTLSGPAPVSADVLVRSLALIVMGAVTDLQSFCSFKEPHHFPKCITPLSDIPLRYYSENVHRYSTGLAI